MEHDENGLTFKAAKARKLQEKMGKVSKEEKELQRRRRCAWAICDIHWCFLRSESVVHADETYSRSWSICQTTVRQSVVESRSMHM
ncbi:hypothetical protein DMENIID0001_014420 [Sergentomyia squamirostris]